MWRVCKILYQYKFNLISVMKLFAISTILSTLLSSCVVTSSQPNNHQKSTIEPFNTTYDAQAQYYENIVLGKIAAGQRHFKVALNYYKLAIKYKPQLELVKEAVAMSELQSDQTTSIEMAKVWLLLDEKAITAWRLLTFYAVKNKQLSNAKKNISHIFELEKDKKELFKFLGQLTFGNNQPTASKLFNSIRKDYPNTPEIPLVIAHIALKKHQWRKALKITSSLIKDSPHLKYAWVLQGIALESNEQNIEAIKLYQKADLQFPETIEFKQSLGHLYYQLDQFQHSRDEFLSIIKSKPLDTDAQYMVAATFFSEENFNKSREYFEPLLRIKRHRNAVLYYLAEMARKEKDENTALKLYKQVKQSRYFETSHIQVSQILKKEGHKLEALNYLKHLEIKDKDSNIRYVRAMDAELLGQYDYAINEFRSILNFEPNHFDAMNALGYTLADHDQNLEEALVLIQQAYNNAPNNAAVIDSLGWVKFKLGHLDEAKQYLERAYQLSRSADIASHLAIVLLQLQQREAAENILHQAYKNDPDNLALQKTIKHFKIDLSLSESGS